MRAIGTIENPQHASRLADYLLTLGISSRVEPTDGGHCIWVHDEDAVPRARAVLADFLVDPGDARYCEAERGAELLRKRELEAQRQFRRNVRDMRTEWSRLNLRRRPLTISLIASCVLVALASRLGSANEPLLNHLRMTPLQKIKELPFDDGSRFYLTGLPEIRGGQVWRLVGPILIHYGPIHLLFNMWWLHDLGSLIEQQRRTWRFALLVLFTAVSSNLAQYMWSGPNFGGMSGVVYGLLGYIWMKSRYDPWLGLYLSPNTITIMMGWLVLCMTGVIGNVANAAHAVGLAAGLLIGVAPVLLRGIRRR